MLLLRLAFKMLICILNPYASSFFNLFFFFTWLCFLYSCPSEAARPLQAFKDKPLVPSLLKERWENQP